MVEFPVGLPKDIVQDEAWDEEEEAHPTPRGTIALGEGVVEANKPAREVGGCWGEVGGVGGVAGLGG